MFIDPMMAAAAVTGEAGAGEVGREEGVARAMSVSLRGSDDKTKLARMFPSLVAVELIRPQGG